MKIIREVEKVDFQYEHGMDEEEVSSFIAAEFNSNNYNLVEMPREEGYVIILEDSESNIFYAFWDSEMYSFDSLEEIVNLYADREYMESEFNFGRGEISLKYQIHTEE